MTNTEYTGLQERKFLLQARFGRSDCLYGSAGYLCAGISCRLTGKIIHTAVYNHCFSDNFRNGKPIGGIHHPGGAVIAEQRRKIALMGRMGTEGRIKMRTGIGIRVLCRSAAGMALVNVETENI